MSQTDYAVMTNDQLKRYIVKNHEDEAALRAYVARRNEQNSPTIANVGDADFDDKLQNAIAQKLEYPASL